MSGLKQHGQEVRQNHGKSMARVAVALGCLSKPAQTKQSPVGAALYLSLGIHGIQLLLVVATFIKCKITGHFSMSTHVQCSHFGVYTEIRETLRDDAMFRAEMKKSSSSIHPSPALLELQYCSCGNLGTPLHQSMN